MDALMHGIHNKFLHGTRVSKTQVLCGILSYFVELKFLKLEFQKSSTLLNIFQTVVKH